MEDSVVVGRGALKELERFARLPVHRGRATLQVDGSTVRGVAEFILPAEGHAVVAFRSESSKLGCDFANDLVIEGTDPLGSFRIHVPQCHVQGDAGAFTRGWSLAAPINQPVRVEYGPERPVHICKVLLNNFDYACGDAVVTDRGATRQGTRLQFEAGGRLAEFRWRPDHDELLALMHADILPSGSLTEVSFEPRDSETDDDLMQFAQDIAAICTFAVGASVGVAMLEMLDADGAAVRRVVTNPVGSRYCPREVVSDIHLPALFRETFHAYVSMRQSDLPWRKLPSYCGSLEDCPYLEQKFAAVVMALEFFMRNCLIEAGRPAKEVASLTFHELIGAAKNRLSWEVPKHYAAGDTTRLLRNAVMHGGELPTKDSAEFRLQFDKWRLFLFRRVLIRLGYSGEVVSPYQGIESSSHVADFSADHNSFEPNGAAATALTRLFRELEAKA
jgi:hypothetical protein